MQSGSPSARVILLTVIAALTLGGGLALRFCQRPIIRSTDVQPAGRWHLQPSALTASSDSELARILSLPYVAGSGPVPTDSGVLHHEPLKAFQGLNLYVSGHGPEALLVDMEGQLVHRWHYEFRHAFPEKEPGLDTDYFRRVHLYGNGDLLAIYQGGGMVKLDAHSRLVWRSDLAYFNHLSVGQHGRIYAIAKRPVRSPDLRSEIVLEDSLVVLSPGGKILERVSLLDSFLKSSFADLILPLPQHADIFHTNTVTAVQGLPDRPWASYREGDLLVSLREVDIVAFIDLESETVRQAWRGPWIAQHQPVLLSTGRILLFDNQGAKGHSRVLEFDPKEAEVVWEYPDPNRPRLSSPQAGSCQRLPNGNTLITESEQGRALEIGPDGVPAWVFVSPHRAGRRGEFVATLFDVVRYRRSDLQFVQGTPGG